VKRAPISPITGSFANFRLCACASSESAPCCDEEDQVRGIFKSSIMRIRRGSYRLAAGLVVVLALSAPSSAQENKSPTPEEYIQHTGAVAILALDEDGRVFLIEQYRHPVGMTLWELPAGLLDVEGEDPLDAAKRELAEEADLRAERWHVLADWFNSPGGMTEALRLYLARGLTPVPDAERHEREAEEKGMATRWVPLEEAREAVLGGALHNPAAVVGILAACEGRAQNWRTLRPADAPWPEHSAFR